MDFLNDLQLKIVVGNREKKKKIDAFITSNNVILSNESVETFDVDCDVLDHNPIGAVLTFKDLVVVSQTKEQVFFKVHVKLIRYAEIFSRNSCVKKIFLKFASDSPMCFFKSVLILNEFQQIPKSTVTTRKVQDNGDKVSTTKKETEKRRQISKKFEEKISVNKSLEEQPTERRRSNKKIGERVVTVASGDNLIAEPKKKVPADRETKEVRRKTVKPPVAIRKSQAN